MYRVLEAILFSLCHINLYVPPPPPLLLLLLLLQHPVLMNCIQFFFMWLGGATPSGYETVSRSLYLQCGISSVNFLPDDIHSGCIYSWQQLFFRRAFCTTFSKPSVATTSTGEHLRSMTTDATRLGEARGFWIGLCGWAWEGRYSPYLEIGAWRHFPQNIVKIHPWNVCILMHFAS